MKDEGWGNAKADSGIRSSRCPQPSSLRVGERRAMKSLARMLVALALLTSAGSFGQYPSRPVRLIVHAPPGSAPDIISRVLGQPLSEALGQQIVVENRTGSNGNIAGELVARSTPDGHTLLLCAESILTINPHVYTRMSFDPMKDLVPIATVGSNEFV